MKPAPFEYLRPTDLDGVLAADSWARGFVRASTAPAIATR